tara:strand:- start:240 stop:656 length:417 start_codon:yes stop_codon:yes gene_type:complete
MSNTNLVDRYKSFNINIEPYYYNDNYYHILTLNTTPAGPFNNYVKRMAITNPSTKIKVSNTSYCGYVISDEILTEKNREINICTIDNITEIYDYLISNNYVINERMNNILNSLNSYNLNNSLNNNLKKLVVIFSYKID